MSPELLTKLQELSGTHCHLAEVLIIRHKVDMGPSLTEPPRNPDPLDYWEAALGLESRFRDFVFEMGQLQIQHLPEGLEESLATENSTPSLGSRVWR